MIEAARRGLVLLALACASCGEAVPRARSALLVTLDTTRFDSIGLGGVTPNLDRLAAEGLAFDWCRSVTPVTLPSHASILTGLYPPRHGVRDNGLVPLPDSATTLAERARAAGLETAAFVSSQVLHREFGLDQGFGIYEQPEAWGADATTRKAEWGAEEVVRVFRYWLDERDASRPFLAWVHFFDPHAPYEPGDEFLAQARGDAYLGEVARADAAVGQLVAELERRGLLDETLVAVVADHGESYGQHGEPTHGALVFDATIRVALILRFPGGERAGQRSDAIASVVDLYPTLCEVLGLGDAGDVDGASLLRADAGGGRGVYFETFLPHLSYGWSPLVGWADRSGKYVHGPAPRLFDPRSDPGETKDLLAGRDAAPYRERIAAVLARPALATGEVAETDPQLIESLRGLGYAAVGSVHEELPDPFEVEGLLDPAQRMGELALLENGLRLTDLGRFAEAIEALEGVLEQNPRNGQALDVLGFNLGAVGRHSDEVDVLRRRLELGGERAETHLNLCRALVELGERDQAALHYRRAAALNPNHALVRQDPYRLGGPPD